MSIFVDENKCTSCGQCVKTCPAYIFKIEDNANNATVNVDNAESCIDCGHCVAVCAFDAIVCNEIDTSNCDKINKDAMPDFETVKTFLKSRRSIRKYKDQSLNSEQIKELLDVVAYAPTGKNAQTVKWAVVMDKIKVKELAGIVVEWMKFLISQNSPMAEQFNFSVIVEGWENGVDGILRSAPHLFMAYSHKDDIFGPSSAPICLEYLELAAYGNGFGTCWAGFFDIALKYWPPLQQALGLPEDNVCLGSMMLGVPDEHYVRFPKRNAPDITYLG